MSKMKNLDLAIVDVKRDIENTKRELNMRMKSLSNTLAREAKKVEKDSEMMINPLGVIQREGQLIDALCMRLDLEKKHLKTLEQLLEVSEEKHPL
jgi:hypothetical protein